jgi:hypothetical protein
MCLISGFVVFRCENDKLTLGKSEAGEFEKRVAKECSVRSRYQCKVVERTR